PSLLSWEYLGVLFKHPDPKVTNIECPNFFELDGKWVLIVSPHRRVEYFIGEFDGKTFSQQRTALLDHSENFYAPNCTTDQTGRRVLWGWVRGFKEGQGWNGCLTTPRVLKISLRGDLFQSPAPELGTLKSKTIFTSGDQRLSLKDPLKVPVHTRQFRVRAEFYSGDRSNLRLLNSKGAAQLEISYRDGAVRIGTQKMPLALGPNDPFHLDLFADHSLLEIYVNDQVCFTTVKHNSSSESTLEFSSAEASNTFNAEIHELASGWLAPGQPAPASIPK
ncbi:MAG TPA: GH32 C-terminal domain-containing protein, partial [Verrucomicrobiae bacterium]|nr:GH32 C-terminal domain-containing protein [Verrucomicrobiae bacterium]